MSIGILAGPRSPEATTERGACSSRVQSRSGFARYNYGKVCLHPRSYEARQNLHPPDLPDNLTNWLINSILELLILLGDLLVRQFGHWRETRIPPCPIA